MKWFLDQVFAEPVAFAAVLRLGILMLTVYGVHLTVEQIAATMAFVEAALLFVTRKSVTANTKVDTNVTVTRTSVPEGMGSTTITKETP